ncbi:MAG TPA: methyltransferase domain-containing protein [Candidatus Angelobacter sp.]|nr:methyltransferase domain-containing protein [Candidatus Angelobacter sp.]
MEKLESTRRRYAESIRDRLWQRHRLRLSDTLVSAFAQIPREEFLGPPPWLIRGASASTVWKRVVLRVVSRYARDWTTRDPSQLYRDVAVAIDPTRSLNSGQPSGVATWLHFLELQHGDRVLHVGCGLGYYTAVIAAAVTPGEVLGVELDAALASQARVNLAGVNHVTIVNANGVQYDSGPVDVILVNAGVTHPRALWLDNLRAGGRMLLPLTNEEGKGLMLKVTREPSGWTAQFVSGLIIFDCVGGRDPKLCERLAAGFAEGSWRSVQSVRRDSHAPDSYCWLHVDDLCLSKKAITRSGEKGTA